MAIDLRLVSIIVCCASFAALAQDAGTKDAPAAPRAPSAPAVAAQTAAKPGIVFAAPVPTGVRTEDVRGRRYAVKLRNAREVVGVVRPDDPWEVRDEGGTLRVVRKTGTGPVGLRLWYVGDSNGSIYVNNADIERIRLVGSVEQQESARVTESVAAGERRAQRERELLRAYRSAVGNEYLRTAMADAMAEEVRKNAEAEAKRMGELLAKFPPSRYTLDTPREIERRRKDGVQPTAEEQEFLRNYDEWRLAVQIWNSVNTPAAAPVAVSENR